MRNLLERLKYLFRCPYPITHRWARECVRSGECGCNNRAVWRGT